MINGPLLSETNYLKKNNLTSISIIRNYCYRNFSRHKTFIFYFSVFSLNTRSYLLRIPSLYRFFFLFILTDLQQSYHWISPFPPSQHRLLKASLDPNVWVWNSEDQPRICNILEVFDIRNSLYCASLIQNQLM